MSLPKSDLSDVDIRALRDIAASLPSGATCAEIGSYLGASALVMSSALPDGARLFCIDTWMNDAMSEGVRDTYAEFLSNTARCGDRIVAVRSESTEAARRFESTLDFLFIDGDHSYEGCRSDLEAWLPKLKPGAVVAFHDIGWADGVQRAVGELFVPVQQGSGNFLPNLYWARVTGLPAAATQSTPTMHVAVISRDPMPTQDQIAKLTPGIGDLEWSWIGAGPVRCAETPYKSGLSIHDAGCVGLLAGRQKAMAIARDADILVLLDDDVALPLGWAGKIMEPFGDPDVHLVGCRYLPAYTHAPPDWLEGLWHQHDDGFRTLGYLSLLDGGTQARVCSPTYVWGLCYAVRRETAIKLGGFNPDGYPWTMRRFRGDGETGLSSKARRLGLKAVYQAETHVLHDVPAKRMTVEYIWERSYLQGVSDSYTAIRQQGGLPPPRERTWKDMLRPVKRWLRYALSQDGDSVADVRRRFHDAYASGFAFHQNEVRNDPALLEWVLCPDYSGCRLPEMSPAAALPALPMGTNVAG